MVQLQILSGRQAGARWIARRFPVRIGRGNGNDLRLEEDGVWERHCVLDFEPAEGFILTAQPDAVLTVNREPARKFRLRNGDAIEMGSARLIFWLDELQQHSHRLREALVWVVVVAICLSQIVLIYWLSR
jgi:pSer/pThr/pTyr-binding forkhead associated (FHA) protein